MFIYKSLGIIKEIRFFLKKSLPNIPPIIHIMRLKNNSNAQVVELVDTYV